MQGTVAKESDVTSFLFCAWRGIRPYRPNFRSPAATTAEAVRPLLDAPPCVTWRSTMGHLPRHQSPPLYKVFCSRRARPASVAIASTLSFSHKPLCRQQSLTTSLRSTSPSRTAMRRTHRGCPGHRSASLSITSYNFVLHRQRSLITLLRTLTRPALLCGVPISVPWAPERRPLYHQL